MVKCVMSNGDPAAAVTVAREEKSEEKNYFSLHSLRVTHLSSRVTSQLHSQLTTVRVHSYERETQLPDGEIFLSIEIDFFFFRSFAGQYVTCDVMFSFSFFSLSTSAPQMRSKNIIISNLLKSRDIKLHHNLTGMS